MTVGAIVVGSCINGCVNTPPPAQPKLTAVTFYGQRVCNTFNTTGSQFQFICSPLPTTEFTGWRLTPLDRADIPPRNTKFGWNSTVNIRVQTPSLTSLEIAYVPNVFVRSILTQESQSEARARGVEPPLLEIGGFVQVAAADNGTAKDWVISTRVRQCDAISRLEIVNTSSGGGRSTPLSLVILRSPDEIGDCPFNPFPRWPGPPGPISLKPPPPPPPPPPTSAPQTFTFCERCPGFTQVVSVSECTEQQARITLGYIDPITGQAMGTGLFCHPTRISRRGQCR